MKAEEWGIYEQRFPAVRDRHIFLSIDEFAYIGAPTNLKLALAYSMVLNEMLRHTSFLKMSAFTTGVSTLDVTATGSTLNTTGEVFKLYGDHFGAGTLPVTVEGNSTQPEPRYSVGFDHPRIRAGSATYPLDVVAGLSNDRRTLKLAVVNATVSSQSLTLRVMGGRIRERGTAWVLTGQHLDAVNSVGRPPEVNVRQSAVPLHCTCLLCRRFRHQLSNFRSTNRTDNLGICARTSGAAPSDCTLLGRLSGTYPAMRNRCCAELRS